jgi:hypothetical protein
MVLSPSNKTKWIQECHLPVCLPVYISCMYICMYVYAPCHRLNAWTDCIHIDVRVYRSLAGASMNIFLCKHGPLIGALKHKTAI